jgi:hypothetical protein
MFKYSLAQSTQAGPFSTPSYKMMDFEIPDSINFNPSQSFVQLTNHLNVTTPAGASASDVFNLVIQNTTTDLTPMNVDLIRNCWLSGERVGKIEDIRRVNVLQHNLMELSKSSSEKKSQINTIYQMNDYANHELLSPFVEMHKDGSIPSRYIDAHLRIPLSQLIELGQLQQIDTSKTGKLRLHLELEDLSYLKVTRVNMFGRVSGEGAMANVTSSTTVFTTASLYNSLDQSSYYVGQPLKLAYTPYTGATNGTPVTNVSTTVTEIVYDVSTKKITLTLSVGTPAFSAGQDAYKNIVISENVSAVTATMTIETAELGICENMGKLPSQDALEYLTWTTEEYSAGAQNSMYKIFEVEPNAVNALVMFDKNTSNLLSNNVNLKSYRLRIDNIDVYDRDINVNKTNSKENYIHDSLHFDALNRTFVNMMKPLKNLNFVNMAQTQATLSNRFNQADLQLMVIGTPTPLTPDTKKFQVNLVASDNINNIILFKQVLKSIKL